MTRITYSFGVRNDPEVLVSSVQNSNEIYLGKENKEENRVVNNSYICRFSSLLSMVTDVVVGKEGRVVLPKKIREKYGVKEGDKILVREFGSQILLIPIDKYEKPTKALHGSVKIRKRIDEPKELARKYMRKKMEEEFT